MLREKSENWIEENIWEKSNSNSEISVSDSDNNYFYIDSMKEFQNVLEEKNSEKIVFTQTVNQLVEKIESKQ